MATEATDIGTFQQSELSSELAGQWRRLTRAATFVALLTAPAVILWLNQTEGWSWFWSIVAGLGHFRGRPVAVVGHQKGRDTKEKIRRNFGMPRPEGFRKALRVMRERLAPTSS